LGTPKGTTQRDIQLADGKRVFIYSNTRSIVLQIRREITTELSLTEPSFKVAAEFSPEEAHVLADYLLRALRSRPP
jgi:hypothetical protein